MYGYNAEPPIAIPIYTVLPYCVIYIYAIPKLYTMLLYTVLKLREIQFHVYHNHTLDVVTQFIIEYPFNYE